MSKIYDDWERLVAAVLKREEIWELCHAPSRTPSISSISSDFSSRSSFRLDENIKYAKSGIQGLDYQGKSERIEEYEEGSGVYLKLAVPVDGGHEIKRIRISRRKFTEEEAQPWWLNNKEQVGGSGDQIVNQWLDQYEPVVCVRRPGVSSYGSRNVRVRFSRRRFTTDEAEAWWHKNGQKVCEKYNIQARLAQLKPLLFPWARKRI